MSAAASESPWRPSQKSPAGRELDIRVIRDPPTTRSSKPLSKSPVRTPRDGLVRNSSTGAPPCGASPPDAKAGANQLRRRRHTEPLIQTLSDLQPKIQVLFKGVTQPRMAAPKRSSSDFPPASPPKRTSSAGSASERRRPDDHAAATRSHTRSRSPVRTSGGGAPRRTSSIGAPPAAVTRSASARISSTSEAPGALKRSSIGGWPNANHYVYPPGMMPPQRCHFYGNGRHFVMEATTDAEFKMQLALEQAKLSANQHSSGGAEPIRSSSGCRSNGGKGQPGHSLEHSSRREQGTKKTVRHPPLGFTRSSSAENAFELSLWKKNSGLMQSRLLAVKQLTIHVTKYPVVESEDDAPTSRGLSQACVPSRPKSHSLPGRLGPHELDFAHEVARKLQTACTVNCTRQTSNSQHLVAKHAFKFIFAALVASVLSLILVSPKLLV
jgi:hypothetical protein